MEMNLEVLKQFCAALKTAIECGDVTIDALSKAYQRIASVQQQN